MMSHPYSLNMVTYLRYRHITYVCKLMLQHYICHKFLVHRWRNKYMHTIDILVIQFRTK